MAKSLSTVRIPKDVSQAYGVKSVLCVLIAILKGMVPGMMWCVGSHKHGYTVTTTVFFLVVQDRSRKTFGASDHSNSHASTTVYSILITTHSRATTLCV